MTANIKTQSVSLYNEGRYLETFNLLLELGVCEFICHATRKSKVDWLLHQNSKSIFWHDFLKQDGTFSQFLDSKVADSLLHIYFKKYACPEPHILNLLANSYPELLVKHVRLSKVFLKQDFFEALSAVPKSSYLQKHFKVWELLRSADSELWQKVENIKSALPKYSLSRLFAEVVVWLEVSHFEHGYNDLAVIGRLAAVYSAFIDFLAHPENKLPETNTLTKDELAKALHQLHQNGMRNPALIKTQPVFTALEALYDWINFRDGLLSSYCFDLSYEVELEEQDILLKSNARAYYDWKLDGERYSGLFSMYQAQVLNSITEPSEAIPSLVDGVSASLLFKDLCIKELRVGSKLVLVDNALAVLGTFSTNALLSFEVPKIKLAAKSRDWFDVYAMIVSSNREMGINKAPFTLYTEKDYEKIDYSEAGPKKEDAKNIVKLVSHKFEMNKYFDRHKMNYDVFIRPYLQIGNNTFCPSIFSGNNVWFYNLAQLGLNEWHADKAKPETGELEKYLGKALTDKNWRTFVIGEKKPRSLKGDIDLIVEDSDTILLIQLKRTHLRLNLEEAHYEKTVVTQHAIEQLTDALTSLSGNDELCRELGFESSKSLTDKQVIKWVVSTSLENLGTIEGGCRKVNYFELIKAIDLFQFNSVSDLIGFMGKDRILDHQGVILDHFTADAYQKWITNKSGNQSSRVQYFNTALLHLQKQEFPKAINWFEKCVNLYKSDSEAYCSIGNAYAEMEQFDKAIEAYNRALKFSPLDPMSWINKAICLYESGDIESGLTEFINIFEVYPKLKKVGEQIEHYFFVTLSNASLANETFLTLRRRWDNLK